MRRGIWVMDRTGDQQLCVDGSTAGNQRVTSIADEQGSVEVSYDALSRFMDECIRQHGQVPAVFGRKAGEDFGLLAPGGRSSFDLDKEQLRSVEEVLIARPLVGG